MILDRNARHLLKCSAGERDGKERWSEWREGEREDGRPGDVLRCASVLMMKGDGLVLIYGLGLGLGLGLICLS